MSDTHPHHVPCCCVFRWSARITALVLLAGWVTLVAIEGVPPESGLSAIVWGQLAAMLVLFAGYVLAWRREVLGALVAIAAFGMFYAIHLWGVDGWPQLAFAVFAAPAVLFFVAHKLDTHHRSEPVVEPAPEVQTSQS
jgi:hypothetical protein